MGFWRENDPTGLRARPKDREKPTLCVCWGKDEGLSATSNYLILHKRTPTPRLHLSISAPLDR